MSETVVKKWIGNLEQILSEAAARLLVKENTLSLDDIQALVNHGATISLTLSPSGTSAIWRGSHRFARGMYCGTFALPWNDDSLEYDSRLVPSAYGPRLVKRYGLEGRFANESMRALAINRNVTIRKTDGRVEMTSL
jgi:hypothetical protein